MQRNTEICALAASLGMGLLATPETATPRAAEMDKAGTTNEGGTANGAKGMNEAGAERRAYGDDNNTHHDGYGEPNRFHGGSKPVVFPRLSGQVGLRYPIQDRRVTRLDLGVATSGLFVGLGANHSL